MLAVCIFPWCDTISQRTGSHDAGRGLVLFFFFFRAFARALYPANRTPCTVRAAAPLLPTPLAPPAQPGHSSRPRTPRRPDGCTANKGNEQNSPTAKSQTCIFRPLPALSQPSSSSKPTQRVRPAHRLPRPPGCLLACSGNYAIRLFSSFSFLSFPSFPFLSRQLFRTNPCIHRLLQGKATP